MAYCLWQILLGKVADKRKENLNAFAMSQKRYCQFMAIPTQGFVIFDAIMAQPTVIFLKEQHRQQLVLSIYAPNKEPFNAIVRKLGCTYSSTKKMWWLPWGKQVTNTAYRAFKGSAFVDYSALKAVRKGENAEKEIRNLRSEIRNPNQGAGIWPASEKTFQVVETLKVSETSKAKKTDSLKDYPWTELQKQAMRDYAQRLRIRGYSQSTFKTYGFYFKRFLAAHPNIDPKDISEEQIIAHIVKTVQEHNYATKTQNQIINAIKFYYEKVLGLVKKEYWIPRPRKEFKLPVVASEEEIVRMLVAADNLKYQCIIGLIYSAGLRRGELVNMRISDIDFDRKQVCIRQGKGKKDRVSLLSERMANALQKYLNEHRPNYWLFESQARKSYSGVTIGVIVREAGKKAGIKKTISPHVLRHSFATHLMDKGTDTRYIQELLGHANIKTTAIYAHVSTRDLQKIVSPLDRIFNDRELKNNKLAAPSTEVANDSSIDSQ